MKKRARVIQISGLRGILMMAFIGVCLVAGFVGFPAICAMKLWNYASNFAPLPLINFYQGLMLWAIVAISGFIINDKIVAGLDGRGVCAVNFVQCNAVCHIGKL